MGFSWAQRPDSGADDSPASITPDQVTAADDAASQAAIDGLAPPSSTAFDGMVDEARSVGGAIVDVVTAPFHEAEKVGAALGADANAGAARVEQDLGDLATGAKDVAEHGQDALAGTLPDAVGNAIGAATGPVLGVAIGLPLGIALLYLAVTRL